MLYLAIEEAIQPPQRVLKAPSTACHAPRSRPDCRDLKDVGHVVGKVCTPQP